ncbi:hypothetical protein BD410DRAFT_490201 [Rickenella mellea]|uniref:Uncharacterized protein n=1 Tax=Rickenella mellea TaxID=50990 RepID=A0A4Y7PU90_9AGAM|nr:hypothetical protein BD410DRAFT_490201 [Rickenella mellea]
MWFPLTRMSWRCLCDGYHRRFGDVTHKCPNDIDPQKELILIVDEGSIRHPSSASGHLAHNILRLHQRRQIHTGFVPRCMVYGACPTTEQVASGQASKIKYFDMKSSRVLRLVDVCLPSCQRLNLLRGRGCQTNLSNMVSVVICHPFWEATLLRVPTKKTSSTFVLNAKWQLKTV